MTDKYLDGQDEDSILEELRQAREALFADANYDIYEFCRRLAEQQGKSGHPIRRRGSISNLGL